MFTWVIILNFAVVAFHNSKNTDNWAELALWLFLLNIAILVLSRRKIAAEWGRFRSDSQTWLHENWKNWGEPLVIAVVLAFVIRTFLIGPYKIPTTSMVPTFLVGDRIFVDKVSYRFQHPKAGDVIVFKYPLDPKKDFVKRLVGLPGDKIQIKEGKLIINGKTLDEPPFSEHYYYNREEWDWAHEDQTIEVPQENYFVLGDNSAQSSDSRNWGFVPARNVIGKAIIIWFPLKRIKLVK